jgi:hypothetical protein
MNARAPIPELAKHLRAIEEDNRRDREWMGDERLELIVRLCGLIDSHVICAGQAAWRGDQALLGYHLSRARVDLISALQTYKALPPEASEGAQQ